ncbi:hypothetical protein Droror1_Dr00016820 [Drosera rotundifolia]
MSSFLFSLVVLIWTGTCDHHVLAQWCTDQIPKNMPLNGLSTKADMYEFSISKNETWRQEVFRLHDELYRGHDHDHSHDQYHLTPTDESTWASLFPRKALRDHGDQFRWNMAYKKLKYPELHKLEKGFLQEMSLQDVRLDKDSMYGRAQATNTKYLLTFDVDRLVWSFRNTAGLPTPGQPYGGWEATDMQLRGHFVGHYLSAAALTWASTHNPVIKQKMTDVVSALKECQNKIANGYLSAFPSDAFDTLEDLQWVWAPYYTIHKIMAGLLDQHTIAGNPDALNIIKWMVDYFYNRMQNVIERYTIQRVYLLMNDEFGGMNDVLYRLYRITGDEKHLWLAHIFDKPCFLGRIALQANDLVNFHANTHIAVVIGAQMRYEVTGDELFKSIGTTFLDIVNSTHTWSTGGTSDHEHWHYPMRLGTQLNTENEETCTTYNMLKISRNLFRWTKSPAYADYYERALINGILSVQRGQEPGVMIYFLPQLAGASKAISRWGWGNQTGSLWCCYGTGMESFAKLGDSIYFEDGGKVPGLYIIQYIPSTLHWRSGRMKLHLKVDEVFSTNSSIRVTLTITTQGSKTSTLNLRIPSWTKLSGANASLSGGKLVVPNPGNYLSITKQWNFGDQIVLNLPITLRTDGIQDDRPEYASLQAIMFGPYVLAGLSSQGDYQMKLGSPKPVSEWVTPVPMEYNSQLISLSRQIDKSDMLFISSMNAAITMESTPMPGNHTSVSTTYRLILVNSGPSSYDSTLPMDCIGKLVMLEPFDYPGMALAQQGVSKHLQIVDQSNDQAVFKVIKGLDGKRESISLESRNMTNCFVHSGAQAGEQVTLSCINGTTVTPDFGEATSFAMRKGLTTYPPLSFTAKTESRGYLLLPLLNYSDEHYTVYFNITG